MSVLMTRELCRSRSRLRFSCAASAAHFLFGVMIMTLEEKYEICRSKLFMLSCHIDTTLEELDQAKQRVAKLERMIETLPNEIKKDIFGNEYERLINNK